jgi:DNA segregation ATPase FtsK/SpoIIIE-like protein
MVEMTRRLLAQGRGANVHMLISTQHPVVSVFGDSASKRNLTGRIALKVADFEASRVAIGGKYPRADHLLGAGDSYLVTPNAMHRAQLVFVDHRDFDALPSGEPILDEWPEYRAEDLGQSSGDFDGIEIGVSVLAAHQERGRPTLREMVEEATGSKPGNSRAARLLRLGRDAYNFLVGEGWTLCESD